MKYSTNKEQKLQKLQQIDSLESKESSQELLDSAPQTTNEPKASRKKENSDKTGKKNKFHTFYINDAIVKEMEGFLKEYAEPKESKNIFVENAIRFFLDYRIKNAENILKQKLQKLQNKQ